MILKSIIIQLCCSWNLVENGRDEKRGSPQELFIHAVEGGVVGEPDGGKV